MKNRFSFPDELGEVLLARSYGLKIHLTRLGNEVCASFKLEGSLQIEREETDADGDTDTEERAPEELDAKLLRRLLDRFQQLDVV